MQLLTARDRARLLNNGRRQQPRKGTPGELDLIPLVKLFQPDGLATWLLTEIDPEDPDRAFGLADLGLGHPELGDISLEELRRRRGWLRLPVERDRHFRADKSLSRYADEARRAGRLVA